MGGAFRLLLKCLAAATAVTRSRRMRHAAELTGPSPGPALAVTAQLRSGGRQHKHKGRHQNQHQYRRHPDHFIPALYFAGLAVAAARPARVLIDGCALGSLSMTSYTLDAKCPVDRADGEPAATIPDPATIPSDETNV